MNRVSGGAMAAWAGPLRVTAIRKQQTECFPTGGRVGIDPVRQANLDGLARQTCTPRNSPALRGRAHQEIRTMSAETGLPNADPTKEYVLSCPAQLVLDGLAQCDMLDNGDMELRFSSGETYLLGNEVVTRTA
jgi:hypothetical protein